MRRPSLRLICLGAARVRRAVAWITRKLRRTPDPRLIEEVRAQQEVVARHVIDSVAGLDAYRRQVAGDDLVKQALLTDIERQAILTIQSKLSSDWKG